MQSLVIVEILLCCFIMGCSEKVSDDLSDELIIMEDEPEHIKREAKRTGVYVDVTPSMKGFLGMQTDSYKELVDETKYMVCLDEISKIIASKMKKNSITYYRVDTPLWRTNENVLEKAKETGYYINSNKDPDKYYEVEGIEGYDKGYDSLCLTSALQNCIKDDFSIIITDFYENNCKAAEVINMLKENIDLYNDRTVGIIGIKSEFAGMVYDLSAYKDGIEYGIVEEPVKEGDIKYRPFYVIVIGYSEMVQGFCRHLQDNMNIGDRDFKYTVFYEDKLYSLDYTNFYQCHSRSDKKDDKLWPVGNVKINGNVNMDIYECSVKPGMGKNVLVSYEVEGEVLEEKLKKGIFELPEIQDKKSIEVSFICKNQKVSVWNGQNFEEDNKLSKIFSIEKVDYSVEENRIYVSFRVFGNELPENELKLSGEICFSESDALDCKWGEQWNLKNGEEDCSRTRNLKDYFKALEDKMPEKNNQFLDFVFYLKCK